MRNHQPVNEERLLEYAQQVGREGDDIVHCVMTVAKNALLEGGHDCISWCALILLLHHHSCLSGGLFTRHVLSVLVCLQCLAVDVAQAQEQVVRVRRERVSCWRQAALHPGLLGCFQQSTPLRWKRTRLIPGLVFLKADLDK